MINAIYIFLYVVIFLWAPYHPWFTDENSGVLSLKGT